MLFPYFFDTVICNFFHSDVIDKEGPIVDYVLLTITDIVAREVSHGSEELNSMAIPLYLRRFEGQTYVIGPQGATIGSGLWCLLSLQCIVMYICLAFQYLVHI